MKDKSSGKMKGAKDFDGKGGFKDKRKSKPKEGFKAKNDMNDILSDPRFAHVASDPKYRHMPKDEHKVKIDDRFASMFSNEEFYKKTSMDPRGRPANFSTKEDLRRFYHQSSDESDDDEEDEEDEDEEILDGNEKENKTLESGVEDETIVEEDEDKATLRDKDAKRQKGKKISMDVFERLQDMTQDYARGAMLFSDDSSDDDSTTTDEDEQEEEFEWGELDQDAVWDTEQEVEETSRFAVCNLDWNHIKAVDIMVVFHSFCPRGGSVKKVTIYPSEFGKQRLAEEDRYGPTELVGDDTNKGSKDFYGNDVDLDRLERGKLDYSEDGGRQKFEALRRYERNRLRYYYAVVECDSVETASALYKQCDRQSFERAGVVMDLRYIPSDMEFDEHMHDVCDTVPEFYESKLFVTTALFDSQPTLTWDQTDPNRQKALSSAMKKAMTGQELNENYLKTFIASSSEEESEVEAGDYSSDEGEEKKNARIANFRALIQEIDDKEKKKNNRFDMEQVFGTEGSGDENGEKSSNNDISSDEEEPKETLKPFEKYLEKRKKKRKERQLKSKKENSAADANEYSDDELPEGMDDIKNDPFFAEEMKAMSKEDSKDKKKKKKKKKKNEDLNSEESDKEEKGDLALLVMDEEQEEKKHFSMREIIKDHKKSQKKQKRKDKEKMDKKAETKEVDDFELDTSDPRFSNLFSSGDFNIDPSHPRFKRTKAVDTLINDVQKKRVAESYEITPEAKRQNTEKGREQHELSMLMKRVKNKVKKPK